MASKLKVTEYEQRREDGTVLEITPASAGWKYVGYRVVRLAAGEQMSQETLGEEACLVLLAGRCSIRTTHEEWAEVGGRAHVFERVPPHAVYVPAGDRYEVTALTDLDLAICTAPSKGSLPARWIKPEQMGVEHRGTGNMQRLVHNILPETEDAESLLVVEVYTDGGNCSSYPPHKHDRDALPEESLLEETYYFKIDPPQGFAMQRVYTDDRSLDETLSIEDGEAVLVPRGYHPVSAPAGYDVYYLNVMAGPVRKWKFYNDPDHEWMLK